MTDVQERRARGAGRVELAALVEICGNEPGIPAFEAEAMDVSARGMHLRTAYLPQEGTPLVCRFEEHGREIIVEGVVAWRREAERGGEFGIKFTALDSRSVDALRELVKSNVKERDGAAGDSGSRVRLHIEGLGSPMKARVREGSRKKVQVGSSLEFLKVGRKLEVEDLEAGERRIARIDGVDVTIDPQTQVPQLVVGLRYEGMDEEDTPQPSVMDLGADPVRPSAMRIDAKSVTASPASTDDPTPSGDLPETAADGENDDDVDESAGGALPAATLAARRLGQAAENAGQVAKNASEAAIRAGSGALRGFGQLLKGAGSKVSAMRDKDARAPRRTTAPPPDGKVSVEGKRLRPQASARSEAAEAPVESKARRSKKRAAAGAAVALVLVTGVGFAFRGSSKPSAAAAASSANVLAALPPTTALPANASQTSSGQPVTASVPLFGPTPLATLEPAPLGPPPGADAEMTEASERRAAAAAAPDVAPDEEFVDAPAKDRSASSKAKKSGGSSVAEKAGAAIGGKPEDVPAWGKGRMNLPVIHRIRLDAPGAAIHGAVDPMGFTVLIPERKMMESGTGIRQRDDRIAKLRTTNTPGGAQLRVSFKSSVPAYRVRLRRDYLEILISSPEKK